WSWGLWAGAQARSAFDVHGQLAGVRVRGGSAHLLAAGRRSFGDRLAGAAALGIGADLRTTRPTSGDMSLQDLQEHKELVFFGRVALRAEAAIVAHLIAFIAIGADAAPTQGRFVVERPSGSPERVFAPPPIRPWLLGGIGARFSLP